MPWLRIRQIIRKPSVIVALVCLMSACQSSTQRTLPTPAVVVRPAALLHFRGANSPDPAKPGETDCNSPGHWDGHTLYVFNSAGHPWRSAGPDLFHLDQGYLSCEYNNKV